MTFIYSGRLQSYTKVSSFKAHCRTKRPITIENWIRGTSQKKAKTGIVFSGNILQKMCSTIRVTSFHFLFFVRPQNVYEWPTFQRSSTGSLVDKMRVSQAKGRRFDACLELNIFVCKPWRVQRLSFGLATRNISIKMALSHCNVFGKETWRFDTQIKDFICRRHPPARITNIR